MENRSFDISHLIPTPEFLYGFSTCTSIGSHSSIQLVALDDLQLGVHKVSSSTTHNTVQPPAPEFESPDQKTPTLAWEALYPAGSVNPSGPIPGGFGFYLSGPSVFAQRLESATEAIFSYRMMLQDGWEWVKGGKLPGLCKSLSLPMIMGMAFLTWYSVLLGISAYLLSGFCRYTCFMNCDA